MAKGGVEEGCVGDGAEVLRPRMGGVQQLKKNEGEEEGRAEARRKREHGCNEGSFVE